MGELFMKYPIDSIIIYGGIEYRVLGYELYNKERYLICTDGHAESKINVRHDI